MSKKAAGTGIMRLLFGLGKKEMKVIPYNQMTPQQFEELDRFLGKVGFAVAGDSLTLTKKQGEYVINQIRQLDLYRKNIMSSKKPDFTEFIPRENLGIPARDEAIDKANKMTKVEPEFKGFEPKVIEGGKGKTKPGSKIDYDKMSNFLGVKLRGDETFDELLEIEKRMKNKDPEDFAGGGLATAIAKIKGKYGKKAIMKGKVKKKSDKQKRREMFEEFNKRSSNADGGLATMFRPKLKDGGPPNPGRRNFMKLMAGLASLPIIGKIFKPAKIASKVVPLKNTTTTMPAWFPDFVDKMVTKNVGDKIDADVMLYKDKDLPVVELYKYDDGRIEVQGKNAYDSEYDINYTPPGVEVLDYKTGKSVKTKGDFEASDTVYRQTGPEPDDVDVDGAIVNDVDDILGGNSTQLEGYAKGTGETKYTKGQRRIDKADSRLDFAEQPDPDIDAIEEANEGYAKGGLATMFRKK